MPKMAGMSYPNIMSKASNVLSLSNRFRNLLLKRNAKFNGIALKPIFIWGGNGILEALEELRGS